MWLHFSDGSTSPLDNYEPTHFTLSAASLDERVVTVVRGGGHLAWPAVVAHGDGQGGLVRVELSQSEACWTAGPHPLPIANGTLSIRVKVEQQEEPESGGPDPQARPDPSRYSGSALLSVEAGRRESEGQAEGALLHEGSELNRSRLVALEPGVYALLGVLGLALLVLLPLGIRHRSRRPTSQGHHWAWPGQEEGLRLQQDELPGGDTQRGNGQGQLSSPTTERKRVQFTTFSLGAAPCPPLSPIQWVCPDMKLQEHEALRTFMEQLDQKVG